MNMQDKGVQTIKNSIQLLIIAYNPRGIYRFFIEILGNQFLLHITFDFCLGVFHNVELSLYLCRNF